MQLGSRPLFPFLFVLALVGCGDSGGSGTAGGTGGSSPPATGGTGGRGGTSATGGTGGASATGGASGGSGGASATGGASGGSGGASATGGTGGTSATGGAGGSTGAGGTGGSAPPADAAGPTDTAGPSAALGAPVEFVIPRANNYPHDPAVDDMGRGWWVDSDNSFIGYWDPATNMTRDFASGTRGCYLHGLNPDDKGNIWYTGKGCNKLGKLDPGTGMVTEYPVMGDPHTVVFHKGALWFTIQNGNAYGRLDPATGQSQVWPAGAGTGPYGIWPAPDGTLWMALFGSQGRKIAQIDPANPAMLRTLTVPNGGNPRRIAVDRKGHVYYTDYPRGYLGRYDPAANKFEEFLSPKGAGPGPYGITIGPDDRIYYFQGQNSIAVFNPAAPAKWEVVQIRTGGVTVRNMATDFNRRRVWLGLNGPNPGKIAYIQVP